MRINHLFVLFTCLICVSCEKTPEIGEATITFHQEEPILIMDEKFVVSGNIQSDAGTYIEGIDFFCLYRSGSIQKTIGFATIDSAIQISPNNYEFSFSNNNRIIAAHLDSLIAIKVDARMKDGNSSSDKISVEHFLYEDN